MNLGNAEENRLFVVNNDKKYFASADDIHPEIQNNSLSYIINAVSENSVVLDVGYSYGYVGEWLTKNKDCQVYEIDINTEAVEYVKEKGYYKNVFNLDLDYPEKTKEEFERFSKLKEIFDFAICADVLEHLKQPTQALEFIVSKLKFGGQVLVSIPNIAHMDIILNLLEGKFNYSEFGILDNTHLRFFTKKSFVEWIKHSNDFYKTIGFQFDVKHIGSTSYSSESQLKLKNTYPYIYNQILKNNPDVEFLQHIFVLTKVNSFENTYGLEKLLNNTHYDNALYKISEENSVLKQEIENLTLELSEDQKREIYFISSKIEEKELEIKKLQSALSNKDIYIKDIENKYNDINNQLANIYNSHGWKLLSKYYKVRNTLLPEGTKRRRFVKLLLRDLPRLSKKSLSFIKAYGVKAFIKKAKRKILSKFKTYFKSDYEIWIENHKPKPKELESQRNTIFSYTPTISIIVPTYNTPEMFLVEMIESVLSQTYPNWELAIADASNKAYVREILKRYAQKDPRIKVKFLDSNKGISGNTNEALKMATGDYIAFLDHDDSIDESTIFEITKLLNENKKVNLIYSDCAITDENGKIKYIAFNPEFARMFYISHPYIVHLVIIKKNLINNVGGLDEANFKEGVSHDVDLMLKVFANIEDETVFHIPKVLYYWKHYAKSTSHLQQDKVHKYTKMAIQNYLSLKKVDAKVEDGLVFHTFRIRPTIKGRPLISIIISTKDKWELLSKCIESIHKRGGYNNFEIIIVKNNTQSEQAKRYLEYVSKEHNVIEYKGVFNYSTINNYAVNFAKGEFLLFLNDDIEFIKDGSILALLEIMQLKEVGIVGAKLLYPDNKIQHAGVIIGLHGIAEHWHKFINGYTNYNGNIIEDPGYISSLVAIREYSAVTGACLMISKKVFNEIGGFSEDLELGYNDIDLCLKTLEKGYKVLYTPYAMAYHYESASRKSGENKNIIYHPEDSERFFKKWNELIKKGDKYYSPNLHHSSYIPLPKK